MGSKIPLAAISNAKLLLQLYYHTCHSLFSKVCTKKFAVFKLTKSSMSSVSTSSVSSAGVIRIPNYELLPTSFLKGLEDAALATSVATNVSGDLFNMSRADILPLTEVAEDAVILIPLFTTENSVVMNSTILAEGPMVYIRLDGPPQPRAIFGTCVAYSEGADIREVAVGAKVQFPPPPRLLVGKPSLVDLFNEDIGTAVDNPRTGTPRPVKRLRTRLLEDVGELGESGHDGPIEKGMTKYILDLDGCKHVTRNKSDIAQREKDLGYIFRTVDKERWE